MADKESLPTVEPGCLLVSCHPLRDSLCHHLVARVEAGLKAGGVPYEHLDLYASGFDPVLSAHERETYFGDGFDPSRVQAEIAQLLRAGTLILVFPTWWFGMPALLKGWFDRVWAPEVAFRHTPDKRKIVPHLHGLAHCLAITTTASPWWVDRLVVRRPVRRILEGVMLRGCAPKASFEMLSLHDVVQVEKNRVEAFDRRIDRAVARIGEPEKNRSR